MCRACAVNDAGTIAHMVDHLIETLALDGRPVIIDEFDFIADRKYHEIVREIHDKSGTAFILIGEEMLPGMLEMLSERFHNRILDFVATQPSGADDAYHLCQLYHPRRRGLGGLAVEDRHHQSGADQAHLRQSGTGGGGCASARA